MLRSWCQRAFSQASKSRQLKASSKNKPTIPASASNAATTKSPVVTTNLIPRQAIHPKSVPAFAIEASGEYFRYDPPEALARTTKLPSGLLEPAKMFNGHFYIQRKSLMDAVKERIAGSQSLMVVDGPRGSGKSVLLYQLALQLRKELSDASVLYLADGADWTTGRFAYYPIGDGSFLQPELAMHVLKAIKEQLNCAIDLPQEDSSFDNALPLLKRTVLALLNDRRLIVLIDGANGLLNADSPTGYNDPQGNPLPLSKLPVISTIIEQIKDSNNGVLIAATTKSNPELRSISPHDSVSVPKFTEAEVRACLELYRQLGYLTMPDSDDFSNFVKFKSFVSGGNPRILFRTCKYDAIYQ